MIFGIEIGMNEYDEATLVKWKSDVDEKKELLARKRWLLLHHPNFKNELREVERAAGKRLPWEILPEEIILDYRKYLSELDKPGTPRRAFMVKYDLLPENELSWELAKLRIIAKDGGWGKRDKQTFVRHAWWYELAKPKQKQNKKTSREIKNLTLENSHYWIFIDMQALAYWQREEPENFKRLCKIANVLIPAELKHDTSDKLELLYHLERFKLGRVKTESTQGEPPDVASPDKCAPLTRFPPYNHDNVELLPGKEYLIHVGYEWPEGRGIDLIFSKEMELPGTKELGDLRSDFLRAWRWYTDDDYDFPAQKMIRRAISNMQQKISKTYEYYNKNNTL